MPRANRDRHLPFQPLADYMVEVLGDSTLDMRCDRLGFPRSTVCRWMKHGIPWERADVLVIQLGLHPAEIWPQWIDQALLWPVSA